MTHEKKNSKQIPSRSAATISPNSSALPVGDEGEGKSSDLIARTIGRERSRDSDRDEEHS